MQKFGKKRLEKKLKKVIQNRDELAIWFVSSPSDGSPGDLATRSYAYKIEGLVQDDVGHVFLKSHADCAGHGHNPVEIWIPIRRDKIDPYSLGYAPEGP